MSDLLEQEEYQQRVANAQQAWSDAGHEGNMLCKWQELYECTLLNEEQLVRAIDRRIELLAGEIKQNDLRQQRDKEQLEELKLQQKLPNEGTICLATGDIKDILKQHYQKLAKDAGRDLSIEITIDTDPITDEIWANVDYKEN